MAEIVASVEGVGVGEAGARGRGVYALRPFGAGETIERAPVIVLPPDEAERLGRTRLSQHVYIWGDRAEEVAIAFGYGSLYNHSYSPNARFRKDEARGIVVITALRDIAAGEEILMNYNGEPDDMSPLSFDVVG